MCSMWVLNIYRKRKEVVEKCNYLPSRGTSHGRKSLDDPHKCQARGGDGEGDSLRARVVRHLLRRVDLVHFRRHRNLIRIITLPLRIDRFHLKFNIQFRTSKRRTTRL